MKTAVNIQKDISFRLNRVTIEHQLIQGEA